VTIANRILLGFAAATILLLGLGLYGLNQIGVVRTTTETIVSRDIAFIKQIEAISGAKDRMQAATEGTFVDVALHGGAASVADDRQTWSTNANASAQGIDKAIALAAQYESNAVSKDRADAWRQIGQTLAHAKRILLDLRGRNEAAFVALDAGNLAVAVVHRTGFKDPREAFGADMNAARQLMEQAIDAGQARVKDVYEISRLSIIGGLLVSVIIAIALAFFIRRSIIGPLSAFMTFVEQVGRGDLTRRTAAGSRDEIGQLGAAMNTMVDGLKALAKQSREATENLNAATAEIRASTQEQAASVEEQLAAVQETAATVDEITHSGAQIGKRAQEVIASAQATAQTSSEGLRAVDETAKAMDAIRDQAEAVAENIVALSEKTQAIGDIITTVNDLSERSHLLALNAAIEAAAAGENGKSFAVVASEMKLLADQAKSATGQVRSILGDIQRGINSSVMLTEEAVKRAAAGKDRIDTTQRTITEITGRVQEGVQTFQQIVAATNQQQLGIEQVMGALQNIRQASQQTAAGTRQLDQAAANLSGLSQQLLGIADRYRI
jgi:methyl-accepting chemotaxis protein